MEYEIVGIDTGGTFVDLIAKTSQGYTVLKIPSTPSRPENAVIAGVRELGSGCQELIHGTTVGTNAVLEGKGANVTLVTTKGFRDVIEIGRQERDDIYAIMPHRPEPLVTRSRRLEVNERILAGGDVEIALSEDEVTELTSEVRKRSPDSVAICLLFGFLNPAHENMLAERLRSLGIPVSVSHEVMPEYREFERTSTTVIDAYIKPIMQKYLTALKVALLDRQVVHSFSVIKSSTGLATISGMVRKPVEGIVSGLAGGILAAEFTAKLLGIPDIITLDIGGTSTDVAQISNQRPTINHEIRLGNRPAGIESVDVHTIGAGGGSIASYCGGLLKVGPESAAGDPGPASYGQGGQDPTVTDADLLFGVLGTSLAGGKLGLEKSLAVSAISSLSNELGITLEQGIQGIRRIFHENIGAALRRVSTERGSDPRDFTILAFGGAGPVHAVELAELMSIARVVIPPHPGIWSAFGLLTADYKYSNTISVLRRLDTLTKDEIIENFALLEERGRRQADEDGLETSKATFEHYVSARFVGQSYDLTFPWEGSGTSAIREKFIRTHKQMYGFAKEDEPIELVALRSSMVIHHPTPNLPEIPKKEEPISVSSRTVQGLGKVPVYVRKSFSEGTHMRGPLIVDQLDTTTWVPPGWAINVDKYGFMVITKEGSKS